MSGRVELAARRTDQAPSDSLLELCVGSVIVLGFLGSVMVGLYGVSALVVLVVGDTWVSANPMVAFVVAVVLGPFVFGGLIWAAYTVSERIGRAVWAMLEVPEVVVTTHGDGPRIVEVACDDCLVRSVDLVGVRSEWSEEEGVLSESRKIVTKLELEPGRTDAAAAGAYHLVVPSGTAAESWYLTLGIRQGLARFERSYRFTP